MESDKDVAALLKEIASLREEVDDLSASFDEDELPMDFILRAGARKQTNVSGVRRRRRRRMSTAQRKAVGARMKNNWAARRAANK
jgi:hypothetical protein